LPTGTTEKEKRMKHLAVAALCVALTVAGAARAADAPALQGDKEKLGYSIGMDIGATLKRQGVDVDVDSLTRGLKDSYTGGKTLLTDEESRQTIMTYQKQVMERQAEAMKQLAEKNKAEGEKFLAENAKKEGVKTLPSGLQYKVIAAGTGKTPNATDTVVTNYRGMLIDGKEFDSSYKRGEPATFPVSGVIAGWTEALQLMKEGAKWEIFLPPNLAYGERGAGRDIGPNATLIFEVELISVK
jgi:FKBP-type peptidyl-prolyl cis-trans isomerase FklB